MDVSRFMNEFMTLMKQSIQPFMEKVTRRCRPYTKGVKTQNQPTSTNFEQHVDYVTKQTLNKMEISWYPAVCEHLSDTSIETSEFILQVDAKACECTDRDFIASKRGLKIHCGEAQTSLTSISKKITIHGKQSTVIDGKPVFTLVSFLRWRYADKYIAESVGIVNLPHDDTQRVVSAGKSKSELRMYIVNPSLWIIHSCASGLVPQIVDLTQSELTSDEETLPLVQSSQSQQMDQEQLHLEDKMQK